MSKILKELYKSIYNEDFCYENINCQTNLQNAVYLLENMGIWVGDYSFLLGKHGPYSLSLDFASKNNCLNEENAIVEFSNETNKVFSIIKNYINTSNNYCTNEWIECICTLHYLKNILHIEDKKLNKELHKRIPYLKNYNDNKKALEIINKINVVYII